MNKWLRAAAATVAILADIGGVWAIARGSESRKGDGGGEAPGNQSKKHCHAIGITQIGQKYSADTKYPPDLVNATSFGADLQRLPHAKPVKQDCQHAAIVSGACDNVRWRACEDVRDKDSCSISSETGRKP